MSLQQNRDFQNLDQKLQSMVINLAQGPKSFDELKILIQNESESVKQHITNEVQQYERNLAHEDYCKRFLESLWYPEMRRRRETINEAHARTFRWVFEPDTSSTAVPRWDNFVQWLESGQGTYWISGKAGAGKSTLMNYVHQDDRTLGSLEVWSGRRRSSLLAFSFGMLVPRWRKAPRV